MKYTPILFLSLLFPTSAVPAIWLRKDPQTIVSGGLDFFFPFLKQENLDIVRNYPAWGQEVLDFFANKIKNYATSDYAKDRDPELVAQAEDVLRKDYQELAVKLGNPQETGMQCVVATVPGVPQVRACRRVIKRARSAPRACRAVLSPEQRSKLQKLVQKTHEELFGKPVEKIKGMVGIQGPKLADFKRRAAIEDAYAALMKEVTDCPPVMQKDKKLVDAAYDHLQKVYNEVLDTEGLRTAKLMENV